MSASCRFDWDWIDAVEASDDPARETLATLVIEAGDQTITSVLDRRHGLYRRHVVVPLFVVAEWLVSHWHHIWYEIEDTNQQRPDFESRHNLAFAGDGFILPDLTMVPESGRMLLRWTRSRPRHARIEFVDEGEQVVDREHLEAQFRRLVDAVIERLRTRPRRGPAAEDLECAWRAVNALDPDERAFGRAAALLGVDPFDVQDSLADAIIGFWEHVAPSLREDALAGASEDSLPGARQWLDEALAVIEGAGDEQMWSNVRNSVRKSLPATANDRPWRHGYALARAARDALAAGEGRFDFPPAFALHHEEKQPLSKRILGLVATNSPACVTAARRSESGTRFLRARAIGDYLGRTEPGPGLLSSLATARQALSRAFAAELLAPAASLRKRLTGGIVDIEEIDGFGREFGVSSEVIRRQIENHELAMVEMTQ